MVRHSAEGSKADGRLIGELVENLARRTLRAAGEEPLIHSSKAVRAGESGQRQQPQ